VRHGSAQCVRVGLVSRAARHRLLILDNGQGFDPRKNGALTGRGLRLMNYRANMLGGTVTVMSEVGAGARVYCDWKHPESHSYEN